MIHIDIATYLHNLLIEEFGGSKGIRDRGSLEAALNRPFSTFDGPLWMGTNVQLMLCLNIYC